MKLKQRKKRLKKGKSKSHLFEDEGKTLYNYTRPRVKLQQWKPERMQHKKEIKKNEHNQKLNLCFQNTGKHWKGKIFIIKKTRLTREEIIWNKNRKVSGENMKDPLLFFKTAYFFQQCTKYIRMLLISAWDHHVQWCKENFYEVPLSHNPIRQ